MNRIVRKTAAPLALMLGLGVAATTVDALHDPVPQLDAQAAVQTSADPENLAVAFRNASRTALQAVVHVKVESTAEQRQARLPQGLPEGMERFFRMPEQGPPQPRQGSGSGFIVSPDGYVVTNNHVVDGAQRVTVVMTDRREFDAEVVGRDPNTDVAVLKINGKDLPTVRLGDSDGMQIGDWVLALGYPMNLGETVTAGIISAKGKNIGIMRQNDGASAPLEHFIQTDAAINPGNSGGPLINLRGEVVGINTAIASQTGAYAGYGFAVPVSIAKRVADDLIEHGVVRRPRLGVAIENVSPADVEVFGLESLDGSVVKTVQKDGPARDAGLQIGDVIVGLDGERVRDTGDLMEKVALRQPNETVTLDVVRYGERERVRIRLGQFETEAPERVAAARPDRDAVGALGFAATQLTPALAERMRLEHRAEGVVITRVDPASPARTALAPGMVIERLNGTAVRTVDELRAAADEIGPGETVSVIALLPTGERTIANYRLRQ